MRKAPNKGGLNRTIIRNPSMHLSRRLTQALVSREIDSNIA
ncbi:Uncharacterised protein [Vibrio cholerae]|nr:Uncharacterised protein [Vibrio cholerae]